MRAKLHKRISLFFLQFARSADFDAIRAKLLALDALTGIGEDPSLAGDDANGYATAYSKEQMVSVRCVWRRTGVHPRALLLMPRPSGWRAAKRCWSS